MLVHNVTKALEESSASGASGSGDCEDHPLSRSGLLMRYNYSFGSYGGVDTRAVIPSDIEPALLCRLFRFVFTAL